MKIKFHPQLRNDEILISISGDTIYINNEPYDFSPINEGETLPRNAISSDFFIDDINRVNGHITLGVLLPHKTDSSNTIKFPQDVTFTDGILIDTVNNIYPWSIE